MSLNGSLQIGRSAIAASQAALQIAGNNMANAATPGFHRRAMTLSPLRGELLGRGIEVGRGVDLTSVRRVVDIALQSRHRLALSREHGAMVDQRFLRSLESIQNELTGNDLSSELSEFFNAFSELANNPTDNAVRTVVIQQGVSVTDRIATMRREYNAVIQEIDRSIGATVSTVNDLLDRIESVNRQIVTSEPVGGEAASLRDQRDMLINELAQYVDVNVIEQSSGGVDIHVGSTPIFLAGESRGIEFRQSTEGGSLTTSVRVAADGTTLKIGEGELGALMRQREQNVNPAIDTLDDFAAQLIFQVNKLHGQGQALKGFAGVSDSYGVQDSAANLNAAASGLPFRIENGSFQIHLTHSESGTRTATQIDINGDAMSLDDLITEINTNVPNVTASTGPSGELQLTAAGGYEISFSDDTAGALAALGVNGFFTGHNASSIGVREALIADPTLLSADSGHLPGSGGTALAIAGLQDAAIDDLNGATLRDFWRNHVNGIAVRTGAADNSVESARLVKDNLNAQMQATSGVSLDEESINLLTFQRQFQAAARFISVIDETLQTLLSIA